MAGSKKYTVILDSNVLFSSTLTDILIRLHLAGLYRARWSKDIIDEVKRNLTLPPEKIDKRISRMQKAVQCSTAFKKYKNKPYTQQTRTKRVTVERTCLFSATYTRSKQGLHTQMGEDTQ